MSLNIKGIFSVDNWAPAGDAVLSGVFYSDTLDSFSMGYDAANILANVVLKGTSKIIVHIDTVRYNGTKLMIDCYEDKSAWAIAADFANLAGSVFILATDFAPNKIGLKIIGNIICLAANDTNLINNLDFSKYLKEHGMIDEDGRYIGRSIDSNADYINDGMGHGISEHGNNKAVKNLVDYFKERGILDKDGRYIGKGSGSGLGNSGVGYGGYSDYGFRGIQIIYGSDENDNDDDKDKDKKEDKESEGGWWKDLRSSIPPWF